MPRRGNISKRDVNPDAVHNSKLVSKFINSLMLDGKKSTAQSILYESFQIIESRTNEDGFAVFRQAINNVKPVLEIRPRRVGSQTYQVPVDVKAERKQRLAFSWLIQSARERGERRMAERLAGEILEASRNEGGAIRRKMDQHRMAEANRAFAHYRW
ncbi:MAG: 30S ribosomal protein S7 [Candidatus Poribacteria bacterium]|nr:30S ribosomal protein S7 [Candidatus Poribacteria bacterium]MDD9975881.1 30S ribosomal protein S7 [Candidatus Poribacteria bacterium]MDE0324539.1 30S ribosomal protein S7 [Candidatus Poribacteria bacterium]